MSVPTPVIPPGPISPCRPRRSPASSCGRAATRTPSTGTSGWTERCARSWSGPTTSSRPRRGDPARRSARQAGGAPAPRLTYIAAFGPGIESVVGKRLPSDRGFSGASTRPGARSRPTSWSPTIRCSTLTAGARPIRSIVAVPIVVGESICGILQLATGAPGPRTRRATRSCCGSSRRTCRRRSRTRSTPSAPGRRRAWTI